MANQALRTVVPATVNGTVPSRRKPNSETRDREHLTEAEVERLMKAAGEKRYGDGRDTRALQHYLGHKSIQHTVRHTKLSPDRFRDFWRD